MQLISKSMLAVDGFDGVGDANDDMWSYTRAPTNDNCLIIYDCNEYKLSTARKRMIETILGRRLKLVSRKVLNVVFLLSVLVAFVQHGFQPRRFPPLTSRPLLFRLRRLECGKERSQL